MVTTGYKSCCIPGPWGRGAAIWAEGGGGGGEALFQTRTVTWTLTESDRGIYQGPGVGGGRHRSSLRLERASERLLGGAKGAMAPAGSEG